MKLKLLSFFTFLLLSLEVFPQTTITIPSANTAGTGASATIRRKPLGSNRSYERSAMKYSANEIGVLGNISGISFYCDSVLNPGKTAIKVYLKEVTDSVFSSASTVANEEINATLVFSDTLFPSVFIKNNWITIPFTTPFLHANNSHLEIIIETNAGGLNGTDLTTLSKGFRYSSKGNINSMQYWQSNTNSSTVPTGNGTLTNNRPNIQLTVTSAPGCIAPPTAGTTLSSAISTCIGSNFTLSLSGTSTGLGLTYQWMSSTNNSTWDTILNATQNTYITTQTVDKYYACYVKCSGQSALSTSVSVTMNPFYLCYCKTNLGGNCSGGQGTAIDSISFTGTTLAKGSTGCSSGAYSSYPSSGNTTAILTQGDTFELAAKFTGNVKSSVWIDYNRNGVFENSEWTQIALTSATGTVIKKNIYIPSNALPGITGMRVRSRSSNSTNDSTSSCTNFGNSGETEDYLIYILEAAPCTSPPNAGILMGGGTVCSGTPVYFYTEAATKGNGQTYEWYSSPDSITWNLIAGATNKDFFGSFTSNQYIKGKATCGGLSDFTTVSYVKMSTFYNCYCVSGIGGNCTTQATAIDSIAIVGTSFDNAGTGCASNYYIKYLDTLNTTAALTQGETYVIKAKFSGNVRASVWIDYNKNGVYENAEWQQICTTSTANSEVSMNLNIPINAMVGKTGMRIRSRSSAGANDSTSSCTTFGTGETEDYIVTILQSLPCIQPPFAGNTISSANAVCAGTPINFNLVGNTKGTGQTYQWIKSTNGNIWNPIDGQIGVSLKDTVFQNTSYACIINCSGFVDTSSFNKISINPFYNCYCVTGIGGGCVNSATSIDSIAILNTTLDNSSVGCAPTFYTAYTDNGNTTAKLLVNDSYALETKFSGIVNASAWIDFDHSGSFDTTEWFQIIDTAVANVVNTSFIDIPANALLGKTGMRIRTRAIAGVNSNSNACTTFGSGETEDYIISIDTLQIIQGIAAIKNDVYLKVYPNPANTSITIAQTLLKEGQLTIYDMQGKVVKQEQLSENLQTISTEKLDNGIYFYRYTDSTLTTRSSGKIIIIK